MNGAHDLGGKHGFQAIDRSQQENFKHEWEERVFAMTLACGMLGQWNLDQSRFARERADPAEYLAGSYYEHWLHGLELLLLDSDLLTEDELRSGQASAGQASAVKPDKVSAATPARVDAILSTGGPTLMADVAPPDFAVGDAVVVKLDNTARHTRAPGYVKGRVGQVVAHHGSHIFADEHAATARKSAEHLYGVKFEARALWGESGADRCPVFVDLFEPYLLRLNQYVETLESCGISNKQVVNG